MTRMFHLVVPGAWRASGLPDTWRPGSLDDQGFVHLSFHSQLAGTLDLHFADHSEVWLLEVDPVAIGDGLRLEPSRDDALFPHLYRELRHSEVLGWWSLERESGEAWTVPRFGSNGEDDQPRRTAGLPPAG